MGVSRSARGNPPEFTSAGITFALTRLVAGRTAAVFFCELGRDEVSLEAVVADDRGIPRRLREMTVSAAWTRPTEAGADVAEVVDPVLDRLLAEGASAVAAASPAGGDWPRQATHQVDAVLVRRRDQWPVPEAPVLEAPVPEAPVLETLISRARQVIRPVAEVVAPAGAGGLADVVDAMARHAPLRYSYEIVLAEVDGASGAVSVRPRKLFPAGAAVLPGRTARTPKVPVAVSAVRGHTAKRVALPIVARRGPVPDYRNGAALERARPLVSMRELDGTFTGSVTLQVGLRGPGQLSVDPVPGLLTAPGPAGLPGWPELVRRIPDRVTLARRPSSLDLVLLVELGGLEHAVDARVRLAESVVDAVAARAGSPQAAAGRDVRVAVIGLRDHFGQHRVDAVAGPDQASDALLVGCGLSTPEAARSVFSQTAWWQAVRVQDFYAAPIEEALVLLASPDWGWEPGTRHALLVIGGRPPHPPTESGLSPYTAETRLACPHRESWEAEMWWLETQQQVETYAVLDRQDKSDYARRAWQKLGRQGRFDIANVDAGQLARGIRQLPDTTELCLATHVTAAVTR